MCPRRRPPGAAEDGSLPPRHPGPSGPPSPTLPTHRSSPGSGWATLRQRTGLGGSPEPHRASLTQSGASPSRPGASASQSGAVQGFLQAAGGGLQRGFGSNVSLPTLDERGSGALQQVSHLCGVLTLCHVLLHHSKSHADIRQQVCCKSYFLCICTLSLIQGQAWPLLLVASSYICAGSLLPKHKYLQQGMHHTAGHASHSTYQVVIGSSKFASQIQNSMQITRGYTDAILPCLVNG